MKKEDSQKEASEKEHWADHVAKKIISENKGLEKYTVAAGITPSGVVHIGNFREIITVDLVAKALLRQGKKVRFIYSWDDYDVFRKIPANFPNKEKLEKYLRQPITDVPDPFGCHKSFAEHNEKAVETQLPVLNVFPEFLYQSKKYRACIYSEGLKVALQRKGEIKKILDSWRKDPLPKSWSPVRVFCSKCNTDRTSITGYDGNYSLDYSCECGFKESFDFRKKGIAKLQWRVDWPMRWDYEKVTFEPSGKEHSSDGGSNTTAAKVVAEIWGSKPPSHLMYEFISIKGSGGKMSSSKGNTVDLKEMLSVYEPSIVRFLFVRTIPSKSFEVSFDADVLTIYDSFDRIEQSYFDTAIHSDEQQRRIYELSAITLPKKMPYQPPFRHITTVLQLNLLDEKKTFDYFKPEAKTAFDKKRLTERISCAKNWLENYAPEQFLFKVQDSPSEDALSMKPEFKAALEDFANSIKDSIDENKMAEKFKEICDKHKLQPKDLFGASYLLVLNKERGPKLFSILKNLGVKKFRLLVSELKTKKVAEKKELSLPGADELNKKVDFAISEKIKENFPSLRVGVIVADGIKNKNAAEVSSLLRFQEKETLSYFQGKDLMSEENIGLWRNAYSSFGGKPKKNKPSVEALIKRVSKGDSLPNINCVVDLYNYISLKYIIPVGADDLSKVEGKVSLDYAKGSEKFVMLGTSKNDPPKEGEIVYKDSKDVLCRRWNWRECEKTKISEKTSKAIIYLESLNPKDDLAAAVEELAYLLEKHCSAKTSRFLVL